jgi:F-type H+-transporting ATPase subunit b
MKKHIFTLVLVLSSVAVAAGGGHGHDDGHIPLDKIGWQAANLGILLFAIIFFIRKSIVEAFADRQKNYVAQAEKTKSALKEAELALADIKEKLATLEAGEQKSLENAKREAAILKETMIKDAEVAVAKMKKDAELVIANELTKAKAEINAAIVDQAIKATTQKLSSGVAAANTQDANFIKQLEQVRA